MTDYEVQRCTKHCAKTSEEFAPGQWFYSALLADGADLRRLDYSEGAWQGPPEGTIGWWKSQLPDHHTKQKHWAPNDVMLQFFEQLAAAPEKQDMQYVLALLLVRRRVMRLEETEHDEQGREVMLLYCPRRETTYKVPAVVPKESRIEQIQNELAELLQ